MSWGSRWEKQLCPSQTASYKHNYEPSLLMPPFPRAFSIMVCPLCTSFGWRTWPVCITLTTAISELYSFHLVNTTISFYWRTENGTTLNVLPAINSHHNVFYMMPNWCGASVSFVWWIVSKISFTTSALTWWNFLFVLYLHSNLYSLSGCSFPDKETCRNEPINHIAVPTLCY